MAALDEVPLAMDLDFVQTVASDPHLRQHIDVNYRPGPIQMLDRTHHSSQQYWWEKKVSEVKAE